MNLFILDENPCVAAMYHCDKHVVKMHTEAIQMLVECLNEYGVEHDVRNASGLIHAGGYRYHPVTLWVQQRPQNWEWTVSYAGALCGQHKRRFGNWPVSYYQLQEIRKFRWIVHAMMVCRQELFRGEPFTRKERVMFFEERTPFVQAMPDNFKQPDAVEAYRAYYIGAKKFASWEKGVDAPEWYLKSFSE